jgi:hypothetical protein
VCLAFVLSSALLHALPARSAPAETPAEQLPAAKGVQDEPAETPIAVPALLPTGLLVAWKPTFLSVRVDSGSGATFGSDKFQPLRLLVRYTFAFSEEVPFVGRVEAEGGRFQTDQDRATYGSDGYDFTVRALAGAATRITPGFTVFASAGLLSRYQNGNANGGAPTVGVFGAVSNFELEFRVYPAITLSLFAEGAIAPFAYKTQANLGTLSDSSELRGRIQLSFDLAPHTALDVGYDFTRWHSDFSRSTITGNPTPDRAFLVDQREYALTVGLRFHR